MFADCAAFIAGSRWCVLLSVCPSSSYSAVLWCRCGAQYSTVQYSTIHIPNPPTPRGVRIRIPESPQKYLQSTWHGTACLLACLPVPHSLTHSPGNARGEVSEATRRQRHTTTRRLSITGSGLGAATHARTLQPNPKAWKRSRATSYEPKYENYTN